MRMIAPWGAAVAMIVMIVRLAGKDVRAEARRSRATGHALAASPAPFLAKPARRRVLPGFADIFQAEQVRWPNLLRLL